MQQNYQLFFTRVLQDEGTGYEDVPGDNGGPTKCGITIADIAEWNGVKCPARGGKGWNELVAKVKALDPRSAGDIYKKKYWDGCRADDLPSGLDYAVVDYAVNSGRGRSIPTLGALVGVKGSTVSDEMLAACRTYPGGLADLITHFQDSRRDFLVEIARYPHNMKFRNGWLAREARVRKQALDLAAAQAPPAPAVAQAPSPKAIHPDALLAPQGNLKTASTSKTVWAMMVSFGAPILGHLHSVTQPIADVFSTIYSDFPSIVSDAQSTVSAASGLSKLAGGAEIVGGVLTMIGVIAFCVAVQRHVQLKKQQA